MTALTPDDLARIEELAEKATPGPWWIDETGPQIEIWTDGDAGADMIFGDTFDGHEGPNRDDALLLASARTAVPALVAGVRSLQARITELEGEAVTLRQQRHDNLEAIAARDAVIATVKEFAGEANEYDDGTNEWPAPIVLFDALAAAPPSVLARVKAAAWDEGARWAFEEITGEPESRFGLAPGDNPHRKEIEG